MVKADIAARKIAHASARLGDAASLLSLDRAAFVADVRSRDLATFYLFLAIEECIDLAAHIVADAGWTPPEDSASTFDILADRGFVTRDLAGGMRAATGLRNRIAHGYASLDHSRLHDEATAGVAALRAFLAVVGRATGLDDT